MSHQATLDGSDPTKTPGWGPIPASYMFIGITPGRRGAQKTRVPFTRDRSGRLLQRCLGRLGLSRSDEFSLKPDLIDCYVTNLVKTHILTDDQRNRNPTPRKIDEELPALRDEIIRVRPKVIVVLGKDIGRLLREKLPEARDSIRVLNHPNWYGSHGAEKPSSEAFERMIKDYRKVLKRT